MKTKLFFLTIFLLLGIVSCKKDSQSSQPEERKEFSLKGKPIEAEEERTLEDYYYYADAMFSTFDDLTDYAISQGYDGNFALWTENDWYSVVNNYANAYVPLNQKTQFLSEFDSYYVVHSTNSLPNQLNAWQLDYVNQVQQHLSILDWEYLIPNLPEGYFMNFYVLPNIDGTINTVFNLTNKPYDEKVQLLSALVMMRKTIIRSFDGWLATWNMKAPQSRATGKCLTGILSGLMAGAIGGAQGGGAVATALVWAPPAAGASLVVGTVVGAIGGALGGSILGGCWELALYNNFNPSPFYTKSKLLRISNRSMVIEYA
ncbi:MAG: hypothetical protein FD155_2182 [Bacteroidetes bacterium]|nr:MAG: hypothetical protein FD155_2182 [Bacteroidota bacterium]